MKMTQQNFGDISTASRVVSYGALRENSICFVIKTLRHASCAYVQAQKFKVVERMETLLGCSLIAADIAAPEAVYCFGLLPTVLVRRHCLP